MIPPSGIEIVRSAIFHTPGNPFFEARGLQSFEDGALVFGNGKIAACGDYTEVRKQYPDAPVRDLRAGFIVPGFIDTHCHVESSLLTPLEFDRCVLSHGVTTSICDPQR